MSNIIIVNDMPHLWFMAKPCAMCLVHSALAAEVVWAASEWAISCAKLSRNPTRDKLVGERLEIASHRLNDIARVDRFQLNVFIFPSFPTIFLVWHKETFQRIACPSHVICVLHFSYAVYFSLPSSPSLFQICTYVHCCYCGRAIWANFF